MSTFKEHCDDCKKELGDDYAYVHKWLDAFFEKLGYDEKHRDIRHHEEGIEEVRKMWGDKAAEAARIHIKADFYGYVPKDNKDVQKWRNGVVHLPPGLEMKDGILVKTR